MIKVKKYLFILCLFPLLEVQAQVTIGSKDNPNEGALLDLKENNNTGANTNLGLGMPRVKLIDLKPATSAELSASIGGEGNWDLDEHIGLSVYNINKIETKDNRICPGIHIWDGRIWQPLQLYPKPLEQKTLQSFDKRGFEFLESDPGNINFNINLWPVEKQEAARNRDYILGNSKTLDVIDIEGNSYTTSRFYVGYKVKTKTYSMQRSYNCDAETEPNWQNEGTITETDKIFTDGVWMTQHLRTKTMPNGTVIPKSTAGSFTEPQYFPPESNSTVYGALYNWPAAINMGNGENGTVLDPGDVNQGVNDDVFIRGICPDGWHLPSDQEATDLENGIILKTSVFTDPTIADINVLLDYGEETGGFRGTLHGKAMKTPVAISGDPEGSSKLNSDGGFDCYLTGYATNGSAYGYGTNSSFWVASSYDATNAWNRYFDKIYSDVIRVKSARNSLYSVRCKKD